MNRRMKYEKHNNILFSYQLLVLHTNTLLPTNPIKYETEIL